MSFARPPGPRPRERRKASVQTRAGMTRRSAAKGALRHRGERGTPASAKYLPASNSFAGGDAYVPQWNAVGGPSAACGPGLVRRSGCAGGRGPAARPGGGRLPGSGLCRLRAPDRRRRQGSDGRRLQGPARAAAGSPARAAAGSPALRILIVAAGLLIVGMLAADVFSVGLSGVAGAQAAESPYAGRRPLTEEEGRRVAQAALAYAEVEYDVLGETHVGMPYLWGGRTTLAELRAAVAEINAAVAAVAAPAEDETAATQPDV